MALLFAGGASLGARRLSNAQNHARLDEINETALRYAETALDSGRRLLARTTEATVAGCGDVALQAIRLRVYLHSGVKDLRVTTPDGTVRCSAYAETLEFDRSWPKRAAMLPLPARACACSGWSSSPARRSDCSRT